LASCGSECWTTDSADKSLDYINTGPEKVDEKIVKCMRVCFSTKTKKEDNEENLSPLQVKKIKVSAHCGYICYSNNKNSKKSLGYCYAGCLGSILQPRPKN
jgi:hypothetical protein